MQPSRRAFLLGRRAPRTPWQVFCQDLRRIGGGDVKLMQAAARPLGDTDAVGTQGATADAQGATAGAHGDAAGARRDAARAREDAAGGRGPDTAALQPVGALAPAAAPQARWTPLALADVRQARALCAEHGVQLALAGCSVSTEGRPVLWVDPARLDDLVSEPGPVPRWRAGPGVTLGALARVGLRQFADAAPDRTLAAWFADRAAAAWPTGRGDLSGVHAVDVLLADGVADTLGPFGADDGQPLRSAALQQLVPALFRLASGAEAQWCRGQPAWPARYRLDALLPQAPATLNLARMLHGHAGTLAWVEALVLQAAPGESEAPARADVSLPPPSADAGLPPAQARALDRRVKSNFDPAGVFPEPA